MKTQARAAVDAREAGTGNHYSQNFSSALIGVSEEQISIEFYQDPELSLGPEIANRL